jgi:hypothetical protein
MSPKSSAPSTPQSVSWDLTPDIFRYPPNVGHSGGLCHLLEADIAMTDP